jgi:hypothetical protein
MISPPYSHAPVGAAVGGDPEREQADMLVKERCAEPFSGCAQTDRLKCAPAC